jgi:hypothetical protein
MMPENEYKPWEIARLTEAEYFFGIKNEAEK